MSEFRCWYLYVFRYFYASTVHMNFIMNFALWYWIHSVSIGENRYTHNDIINKNYILIMTRQILHKKNCAQVTDSAQTYISLQNRCMLILIDIMKEKDIAGRKCVLLRANIISSIDHKVEIPFGSTKSCTRQSEWDQKQNTFEKINKSKICCRFKRRLRSIQRGFLFICKKCTSYDPCVRSALF